VTGRRSRWATIGFWLVLFVISLPLSSNLPSQTKEQYGRPDGSQSKELGHLLAVLGCAFIVLTFEHATASVALGVVFVATAAGLLALARRVPLERMLSHFLGELFPEMEILERSLFRVTRDADLDVSDEADDLLEAVELELRRARFGEVTRLEVTASMSQAMRDRLQSGLNVADELVYPITGTLDLVDAMELTSLDRPDLKDDPWVPVARPNFVGLDADELFAAIRARDLLTHHPYDSFAASYESFLEHSVRDPRVIAIKSTVYRTSEKTPLVPALIEAAENGKQSVALVEIQARGDERRNIEWSRALEQAGAHVVHGFPGLKIHAKATLVVRRDSDTLRRYVHLGTGNYNAVTAGTYEDFGLFTADEEIAADVADLFNYLTGFARPVSFRKRGSSRIVANAGWS